MVSLCLFLLIPFWTIVDATDVNVTSVWQSTAKNGSVTVDPAMVSFIMNSEELQHLEKFDHDIQFKNETMLTPRPKRSQSTESSTTNKPKNGTSVSPVRHKSKLDLPDLRRMESKSDKSVNDKISSYTSNKQEVKNTTLDQTSRASDAVKSKRQLYYDTPILDPGPLPLAPLDVGPDVLGVPPGFGSPSLLGPSFIGLRIHDDGRGDFFKDVQIAGNIEGLFFGGIRGKRQVSVFSDIGAGGLSRGNQGHGPGVGVTRTLSTFARLNRNWAAARRFLDSPRIRSNPVLRVSFILDPRGVTCPQLCFGHGIHKPTHGLLGICTPDYCECDSWNWKWRQLQCPFGFIFDPLKTTCSLPLTSSLCSGEPPAPAGAVIRVAPFHKHLHKPRHSYRHGHGPRHRRQLKSAIPLLWEAAKDF